ncbi:MAG: ABC transporter ATP-binding protein [Clostridiales Family XIII bacterium]|jgi:ABC-2 type transport system ATP-binding protein|nr:ABC transporter ATP-binding protein [Clostridiales Family XIII bacterium]
MNAIDLIGVSKMIKGSAVLQDINLRMEGGKIYGLVGRNGSGKTMLLRMLAGLIRPTAGKIHYENDLADGAKIGITIENPLFYPAFTGYKNLMFLANINKYAGAAEVRRALGEVGLDPDDPRVVRKYSLGMKQRLGIAQALMENPDYLFLDEPTNALDEEGIDRIRNLILRQAERGATVVVASHSKEEIAVLCDKLYFMKKGRIATETEITGKEVMR